MPRNARAFAALAEAVGFAQKRGALFAGEVINVTEGRAAEHTALRGVGRETSVEEAGALHAPDEAPGRGDPRRRAGRGEAPDPHRHRRIGARPGAGDRCAGARRGDG